MNLRRLESFLAVVRLGTVTGAARELHIAQPALSRQLKTLQRELRVDLFEPAGAGLQLTPAGQAFLPHARRLVAESQRVASTLSNIRLGQVGVLDIAATLASVHGFLAPFVATTRPDDPTLVLAVARHHELAGMLAGDVDVIVTPEMPPPGSETLELGRFPVWAHVSSDHPWAQAGRRQVPLAQLAEQPLILPTGHSVSRRLLETSALDHGVQLEAAHESDDGVAIQALAAAGRGVGVTTEFGVFDTHAVQIALPHGTGTVVLPVQAAWRGNHYAAALIASLAARIRDFAHSRPPMRDLTGPAH